MAAPIEIFPPCEKPALPLEIHAATRSHHTALNRLITARLPLCLPPHASSYGGYAVGIATFGQIYYTFEQAWQTYLESELDDERVHVLLRNLHIESLSRGTRLEADLSLLYSGLNIDEKPPQRPLHKSDVVVQMMEQIRLRITEKPYLILSHAWVMYMALFNGGRWIRSQLTSAGPEFWMTRSVEPSPSSHSPSLSPSNQHLHIIDCLSFWDFEGDLDGEDIKTDFKARFNIAAESLTLAERQDIIDESVRIFECCAQLVTCLDHDQQAERAQQNRSNNSPIIDAAALVARQSWFAVASSAVRATFSGLMMSSARRLWFQRSDLTASPTLHSEGIVQPS